MFVYNIHCFKYDSVQYLSPTDIWEESIIQGFAVLFGSGWKVKMGTFRMVAPKEQMDLGITYMLEYVAKMHIEALLQHTVNIGALLILWMVLSAGATGVASKLSGQLAEKYKWKQIELTDLVESE